MTVRMGIIVLPPLPGDEARTYTARCHACPHQCIGSRAYVVTGIRSHASACHGLWMGMELN